MTTTYRYLFADLLTNDILAELPLTGVSFTQQLNQAGALQGHLLLSGMATAEFNVNASTIPGRTGLYVDRNGILIWGGVIWGRTYNSADQTLNLVAREFESYFERRRITTTIDFTNIDQLVIARSTSGQSCLISAHCHALIRCAHDCPTQVRLSPSHSGRAHTALHPHRV